MAQQIYIYIDDSGVLSRAERSGYFVYAGYVFVGKDMKDVAARKYRAAEKKIREAHSVTGEIKAYGSKPNVRRWMYNVLREYDSLSMEVQIGCVYDSILEDKKSICRYKDYVLKLGIKNKLNEMIQTGAISPKADTELHVFIDEQLTASNGYYDLSSSIKEELKHGIANYNYSLFHPPIFHGQLMVNVQFCESCNHTLIRGSDFLANRMWNAIVHNKLEWLEKPKHASLTLP